MKKKHFGKIVHSDILPHDSQSWKTSLYSLEGQEVEITITKRKKARPQRSNEQNRYYWGVVIELLAQETGNERDDIHTALRMKFLGRLKDKMWIAESTTNLDTAEMEDYLSKCRMWASADLGIYIPKPDEIDF